MPITKKRKLRIEVEYDPKDLAAAITFMMEGDNSHVAQVTADFFPESKIKIDMAKIEQPARKTYMFNSLAAALITLQQATQ